MQRVIVTAALSKKDCSKTWLALSRVSDTNSLSRRCWRGLGRSCRSGNSHHNSGYKNPRDKNPERRAPSAIFDVPVDTKDLVNDKTNHICYPPSR